MEFLLVVCHVLSCMGHSNISTYFDLLVEDLMGFMTDFTEIEHVMT